MTSKNSFTKLLLQCLKGRIWGIALAIVGYFLALPVYAGIQVANLTYSALNDEFRATILTRLYCMYVLGEGNILANVGTFIIAVFLAFNGFGYLFSKQKVDLYHGISIKREKLFAANYISGFISFVIPYVIFEMTAVIIGAANNMFDKGSMIVAINMLLVNIVAFLLIYSSSIVAIMLTGNYPVAAIMICVINLYFPVLALVLEDLKMDYFDTYYQANGSVIDILEKISPVGLYIATVSKVQGFKAEQAVNPMNVLTMLIATVICIVLAIYLYKNRKSEAATKALSYKKMENPLSVLILFLVSLSGGAMLSAIVGYAVDDKTGWLIFGMVVALLLGHCVVQTIYHLDIKTFVKQLYNPAIAAVFAAITVSIFIFDAIGYDNYIPKEKDFESAAVVSYGLQQGIEYFDFNKEDQLNEWGYADVWVDSSEYRLERMNIKDYAIVEAFAKKAIPATKVFDNAEEYPEDITYASVIVKYNLKNGKSKYREYTVDMNAMKEEYASIYEKEEYKNAVFPMLTDEDINYDNLYYNDGIKDIRLADLTADKKTLLINTAKEETYAQKAEETYNTLPIGYIYEKVTDNRNGYSSDYLTNKTYIYPGFEKTIALLEEGGINTKEYYNISNVSYVELNRYTEDNDQHVEYYDEENIKKIIDAAFLYEMANEDNLFHPTAEGDGNIYLNEGENKVVYITFPRGGIPDFVDNDLRESASNSNEDYVTSGRMY